MTLHKIISYEYLFLNIVYFSHLILLVVGPRAIHAVPQVTLSNLIMIFYILLFFYNQIEISRTLFSIPCNQSKFMFSYTRLQQFRHPYVF